jgi:hypothetical protein
MYTPTRHRIVTGSANSYSAPWLDNP